MTTPIVIAIAAAILLLPLLGWFIVTYNRLVRRRNQVDADWSHVDVQLTRRYDLIGNLVETVKGYAVHEKSTFESVTQARTRASSATEPGQKGAAEAVLSGALLNLLALAEAYPDLKASDNFLSLQGELANTEDRIAHARQFYNDAVMAYHNDVDSFPSMIAARIAGFMRREFFQADAAASYAPQVRF